MFFWEVSLHLYPLWPLLSSSDCMPQPYVVFILICLFEHLPQTKSLFGKKPLSQSIWAYMGYIELFRLSKGYNFLNYYLYFLTYSAFISEQSFHMGCNLMVGVFIPAPKEKRFE